jgi:hypothetical protein
MTRILFLSFLPMLLLANPSWLYNIKPIDKNIIVGYGIDTKLSQAKQNAMADIVKSISVEVDSTINISKSNQNGKYKKDVTTNLQTKAKATLTGIEIINAEELDGLWYVSSQYDNSPLELKLKKQLPTNISNESQNKYLKNTELFKTLNSEVGVNLNYSIIRKNSLWQLKYKDIILPIQQDNFYKLFVNQSNENIMIKANQEVYIENDEMYFNINLSQKAYVSILYVEHNGKVGVLLSNKMSDKSFTYPNLKSEDTFKIANPYNKPIQELYVALYSKNKIDLSEFENVSENLLDTSNYNFDKLIRVFSNIQFTTYSIKIKK